MSAHPKTLAADVARRVGLPASWPNVNVIQAAIELEAGRLNVPAEEIAELLIECARELTPRPKYSVPAGWELRDLFRLNTVDRFWFEDARWTVKFAYANFSTRREDAPEVA